MTRYTILARKNQLRTERLMVGHPWLIGCAENRKECIRVLTEIAEKMNSKIKINKSDLRKCIESDWHCFSLITCAVDIRYHPECPLTVKQCNRLSELYNKYISSDPNV